MPHTAARAYEQRDSVQRRSHRPRHPPNHPRTLVSYSEAASGLLTRLQGTDALASLSGSPYQATHATDTHPRGGFVGRGTPRPARRLSFHILSSPEKKEYGPRRATARLPGRYWLVEAFKLGLKAWSNQVLFCKLALRCGNPSRAAPPARGRPPPQPPPTNRKIAQKQNLLGAHLARPRQSRAAARLFC